jgi:hypothetical protein
MNTEKKSPVSLHRLLKLFLVGFLFCALAAFFHPLHSSVTKLALLGSIGICWLCALILFWKYYIYRTIFIVIPLLACIPFLLPSRAIDATELRANYLQALTRYEGSTYYWGGENKRGIDCSGLPRRSLRDALLRYGIEHANGKAFRLAAEQWYYDTSAKALGQGYRGFTKNLGITGTIQTLDTSSLQPGDLAVTTNGIHVLVYQGDEKWIQADPGIGSVASLHGRNDQNTWFDGPVTIHRWSILNLP